MLNTVLQEFAPPPPPDPNQKKKNTNPLESILTPRHAKQILQDLHVTVPT